MLMKNKTIFLGAVTGACLTMAMTMPSCPGQQAMQQQIDDLKGTQLEMAGKLRGLETQIKTVSAGTDDMKKAIEALNTTVTAQKASIDAMSTSMQQMEAKLAAAAKPTKPVAKKHR